MVWQSLGHAFLVFLYTAGISWVIFNGQNIFGVDHSFLIPLAFLLLFVFSAAIVGALVLGKPVMLYFAGSKTEAVKFFLYTVGWIFLILIVVFLLYLKK